MDFENELTSKILDPIYGTIRLTTPPRLPLSITPVPALTQH